MTQNELKYILQNSYNREHWIKTLRFLSGNKDLLTVHLTPKSIAIHTQEANKLVKSFRQTGILHTSDGISLPIFEIILADQIRIDHNRIGVNDFIKKYIIRDAVKGALAAFAYDTESHKTEWRFSFISKNSASDFFAEADDKETNPKKFTYIFGNREQHRTAIERFFALAQSTFRLDNFFEAFNVEPVSKAFFEDYKKIHRELSDYLLEEERYCKLFETAKGTDATLEKRVRSFTSRLMGRLVFLYFLQKKNWLGASTTAYRDGSPTFLSDLFESDSENRDDFYEKYLCPVFFNALNTADRPQDTFVLENGGKVCIPFLNGGLFEEEQEPEGHRQIRFPASYFSRLFDFFNGYNFTVYENSPDEHTIAVDPEMLGHIFENLIDYNKDTGAFYTPKEIVQYMTRESLIEYLNTHLDKDRTDIEKLIKDQSAKDFSKEELSQMDRLLNRVKICDPAVGSGAFPMGMLQEIFNLKAFIHFQLGEGSWEPAKVKQNIIQNSIYGVDIDEGAIEIARLRFWLSLVVDEDMPHPLPNLDYRIMQGNSLIENFRGIDLSILEKDEGLQIVEQQAMNFGEEYAGEVTLFDKVSVEGLRELVKEYFTANTGTGRNKNIIKKEIDQIVEGRIHASIYQEKTKLKDAIRTIYKKWGRPVGSDLKGINLKSREAKQILQYQKRLASLDEDEKELIALQSKKERPYFLWHLFFGDVLDDRGGFDIVIGNPPYIKEYTNRAAFDGFRNSPYYQGKMDLWYGFACVLLDFLKPSGIECFIAQNNWITSAGAGILRENVLKRTEILQFIDFGDYKVFQSAGIQTMIYLLKKKKPDQQYPLKYALLKDNSIKEEEIALFLDFSNKKIDSEKFTIDFKNAFYENDLIHFIRPDIYNVLLHILNNVVTFL